MSYKELEIIERTAQAKCGASYVITVEEIKPILGEKNILLRVQDKEDPTIIVPCVLPADSTLSEVCEMAEILIEDLIESDI